MLVLSRKVNEKVDIGGIVTVTVLRADDGAVRLGFDAPKWIKILRTELQPYGPRITWSLGKWKNVA